ncbi:hypothetical protein SAMN04489832_5274 [Micromonospora cremea]|uniref:Uncharacterized protein n=1 Tax=Micromonospora cremea TaxID=709881 RepID=A0A1N6ACB0_9ACTN|nr:hypothetical protein SAMN04489832_5274 [Micromonospora cremea]
MPGVLVVPAVLLRPAVGVWLMAPGPGVSLVAGGATGVGR